MTQNVAVTKARDEKSLAWVVSEDEEGHAVVVFAEDAQAARSLGASRLSVDDDDVDEPLRRPEFDVHAPGPVPVDALLADGWWFECYHCGVRVYEDDDGDGDPVDPVPGPRPNSLFCTPACAAAHFARLRQQSAAESALLESFDARYPGAQIVSVYVWRGLLKEGESVVRFRFPGGECQAVWHFGENVAHVSKMDVDAFKAWRGHVDASNGGGLQ